MEMERRVAGRVVQDSRQDSKANEVSWCLSKEEGTAAHGYWMLVMKSTALIRTGQDLVQRELRQGYAVVLLL
jgi:hypothetical protein